MNHQDILTTYDRPLYILLADDDIDDHYFFSNALKKVPIPTELVIVGDGEKLMTYLFKNSHNLPDVLFLDHNMPRKNGSECLLEIKSHPLLKELPVIMYSTYLHEDIANSLYDIGAHFYLRKTSLVELQISLNALLSMLVEKKLTRPERAKFILGFIDNHSAAFNSR